MRTRIFINPLNSCSYCMRIVLVQVVGKQSDQLSLSIPSSSEIYGRLAFVAAAMRTPVPHVMCLFRFVDVTSRRQASGDATKPLRRATSAKGWLCTCATTLVFFFWRPWHVALVARGLPLS